MYLSNTAPTRLGISITARGYVDDIDDDNFFSLGKNSINRSSLFSYAMALGYIEKKQTPIEQAYQGGFIQDMAIDGQLLALMCCQYLFTLPPEDLDHINEKSQIYKVAEQYANTGFMYIEEARKQNDEENFLYDQLVKLDEMYESVVNTY